MAKKRIVEPVASTISGLIEGAYSVFEELAGEMREAFDNTPESLQGSGVGEARGTAADELENWTEAPDVPEWLADLPATYTPSQKRKQSRRDRAGQATYELGVAIAAIEVEMEKLEEKREADEQEVQKHSDEATLARLRSAIEQAEEREQEAEAVRDACQEALDAVDGVEFPGMYG
jgi:hypothetical protein